MIKVVSPRLKSVLECIKKCRVLADIGTDHAYLPIEAVRAGLCETAIACDISPGPIEMAKSNIAYAGLTFSGRIQVRRGDGLKPIAVGEAECITITGMGGKAIMDILSGSPEKAKNSRLILGAQHDLEELRRFLHTNLYNILEEKLVRDDSRYYAIIVAQSADSSEIEAWTDAEYFIGKAKCPDLLPYLRKQHKKILGYINSITNEKTLKLAETKIKWLEEKICSQQNG